MPITPSPSGSDPAAARSIASTLANVIPGFAYCVTIAIRASSVPAPAASKVSSSLTCQSVSLSICLSVPSVLTSISKSL